MKKPSGGNKELDSYIESVKARQRNTTWPDVLPGRRSVYEYLWKGDRNAPLVQRMGAIVFGLVFVMIGLLLVAIAFEQKSWPGIVFAAIPLTLGGWFIRNALRR